MVRIQNLFQQRLLSAFGAPRPTFQLPAPTPVTLSGQHSAPLNTHDGEVQAMRVVSSLTCFAAAGPLLRSPLPLATPATLPKNDVRQVTREIPRGSASMLFQPKRASRNSSRWVRVKTNHSTNSSAVMIRGGAVSNQTTYHRLKTFMNKRFFLLGAATMVASARLAPSFGTKGGLLSLAVSKAGEYSK